MTLAETYQALIDRYQIRTGGEMVEEFSDKGTRHSYIDQYETLLQPYHPAPRLLEIGVMTGASMLLWDTWFDGGEFAGIDIRPGFNQYRPWHSLLDQPHIEFYWKLDSTRDRIFMGREFDIIIDDGSHRVQDQIATFNLYWPLVAPGGIYIIEDIETADAMLELHNHVDIATIGESVTVGEYLGHLNGREDDQLLWVRRP